MKPTVKLPLAIHKTFEKSAEAKREVSLYVSDGQTVEIVAGKNMDKLIASLPVGHNIRMMGVHACDPLLLDLAAKGVNIQYAHWHDTGLDKGLAPADIVQQYANLPESIFRTFKPRPELAKLRFHVSQRLAVLEFRKAATLKLKGAARLMGQTSEEDYGEDTQSLLADIAKRSNITIPVTSNGVTKDVYIDNVIADLAQNTRECVLFNEAAGIADEGA